MRDGLMPYIARRQAAVVAALEVDEGAPRHVEPDLALLLQLSAGLPGVRALRQAQELLERVEPLEGRAVLGATISSALSPSLSSYDSVQTGWRGRG
jgi:hypothetical protein